LPKTTSYQIPQLLDEALQHLGLNIRELAAEVGIPEQRLYDNVKGEYPFSLNTAIQIIDYLQKEHKGYRKECPSIKLLRELEAQRDIYKKNQEKNASLTTESTATKRKSSKTRQKK